MSTAAENLNTALHWFNALDKDVKVAVVTAIGFVLGGLITGVVAFFGFWLTFKTSTAANRDIAAITKTSKVEEMRKLANIKVGEMRINWIENFREESSDLYAIQYEITMIRTLEQQESDATRKAELRTRLRELHIQRSRIRARLLMRINPNSKHEDEAKLESCLKRSVNKDEEQALSDRLELRNLTRSILHREWNKAKDEINS